MLTGPRGKQGRVLWLMSQKSLCYGGFCSTLLNLCNAMDWTTALHVKAFFQISHVD